MKEMTICETYLIGIIIILIITKDYTDVIAIENHWPLLISTLFLSIVEQWNNDEWWEYEIIMCEHALSNG